jgi:hypothetical protein
MFSASSITINHLSAFIAALVFIVVVITVAHYVVRLQSTSSLKCRYSKLLESGYCSFQQIQGTVSSPAQPPIGDRRPGFPHLVSNHPVFHQMKTAAAFSGIQ